MIVLWADSRLSCSKSVCQDWNSPKVDYHAYGSIIVVVEASLRTAYSNSANNPLSSAVGEGGHPRM